MKEGDLYQKIHGNMIFSVYMYKCYKHDIALLVEKQGCPCPKNTLKSDISSTTEKDDIYPRKYGISAEIPH